MNGMWTRPVWMCLAAIAGLLAVAAGAFAAHGMSDPKSADLMHTGASYAFMHAMATFACATFMNLGGRKARFAPAFFLAGIVLFSGSLYALGFGAPRWVGAITPIGGISFIAGWAILAWAALDIDRKPAA
jgi:uncharacterized membrane protein YgdD (TMEM256/DUF423 family)